jgi:hypothetical protein
MLPIVMKPRLQAKRASRTSRTVDNSGIRRVLSGAVGLALLSVYHLCSAESATASWQRPATLDEWLFRFQTLGAALVALLGACVALLTAFLVNRLARQSEVRKERKRQVELANNLISLIDAEGHFLETKPVLTGIMGIVMDVPSIQTEEISSWMERDLEENAVSVGQMAQLWRNVYDECKGFPSPISDLISFSLWAAGRAAIVVGTARQRGRVLTADSIRETAERTQLLLYSVVAATNQLEKELKEFIANPKGYAREARHGFPPPIDDRMLDATLAKRLLVSAERGIQESRKGEWAPSEASIKDSSPRSYHLVLPAYLVKKYEGLRTQFLLESFARNLDECNKQKDEPMNVAFVRALLDEWERSQEAGAKSQ